MMRYIAALSLAALACGGSSPPPNLGSAPAEEPPVALNAEPTVQYPPDLYDRRVEGDVVLHLFVDSTGRLAPESTRVAESSGTAALDTAAVRGVSHLQYAPARRHGLAVATAFLQTVEFRHPGVSLTPAPAQSPAPPAAATPPPTQTAPVPAARSTRPDTGAARPDTVRRPAPPAPDTAHARPEPAPVRPDTTPARRDSTTPPDTTKARPDSNGAAAP
jgi:TonB family protein